MCIRDSHHTAPYILGDEIHVDGGKGSISVFRVGGYHHSLAVFPIEIAAKQSISLRALHKNCATSENASQQFPQIQPGEQVVCQILDDLPIGGSAPLREKTVKSKVSIIADSGETSFQLCDLRRENNTIFLFFRGYSFCMAISLCILHLYVRSSSASSYHYCHVQQEKKTDHPSLFWEPTIHSENLFAVLFL